MSFARRLALIAVLLGSSVGCDQATKHLATTSLAGGPGYSWLGDSVRLRYTENPGAFLSLGRDLPEGARFALFVAGVAAMLLGLAAYALLHPRLDAPKVAALALLLGGGASNWLDRLLNDGVVVDFMNVGLGPVRTGVFNVADIAIMLGIGLLLVYGWRGPEPRAEPAERSL